MFENILVPLDGSPLSEAALPFAIDLAERYASRITLYQIQQPLPTVWESNPIQDLEALHRYASQRSQEYLESVKQKYAPDKSFQLLHEVGNPAQAIVDIASTLSKPLIVMASHGRDGWKRWLLGSVAEKVARHAPCPVILWRGSEAKDE